MAHLIMGEKIYYHKRHPGTPCKKFSVRASCTVEASIVMPVFLFISACILLFFYVLAIEWSVAVALNETAREAALYGGEVKDKETIAKGTVTGLAYAKLISNKTPASHVKGRALGFDFSESVVDEKDILLIVKYTIPFPVKLFGKGEMKVSQQAKAHRWVGFDPSEGKGGDNETVFVTKYGKAWHSRLDCSYLNPSITPVSYNIVSEKRNSGGHKYYPCPLCRGETSVVYITTYGENYHTNITCSGLKRTIKSTTKKAAEAEGFHACSKCGQ